MFGGKNKIKVAILALLFIFMTTAGLGCKAPSKEAQQANQPLTLNYWRVWDTPNDLSEVIMAYKAMHPNVTINVRQFRYDEYEQALLEALAEDRGPDIFSIHNTWLNKYRSKIAPAPESVRLPFERTVKRLGIKEEKVIDYNQIKIITPTQVKNNFVDVVYSDVVWPDPTDGNRDKVYGLPYSVDTLVLFYNKDLLNASGIPEPAQNWVEFQNHVKKIVKQDKQGNIIQAGAAIGTADNVARSFDILSILMMQNGTRMTQGNTVTLAGYPAGMEDRDVPPAEEALTFYTDFAYPAKEVYTWNSEMNDSLTAFLSGQVAYFFGYSYNLQDIKNRAPKLNFGYSRLPQIEGNREYNYANYWVETVAKKSAHQDWAWDFVQFAAAADQVKRYLDKTKHPTALRSLISVQADNEELLPFVSQLLTATSWYRGTDPAAAETIFKELIKSVTSSELTIREAIGLAVSRLQQTM
ncbi:extracellular solute-binding protein [Candidatus Falkowbacteria bacterium]|nr:extracellular solute-binding protein [Candidatus Falkowbacteria bacterium]